MAINLDELDPDQRVAATAPRGPVCILAGAGTGKTRTITYRIAHLIDQGFVGPNRVLAVTFTARAAGEMRHRLARMGIGGVQARTFHAAARRQLRYFWPQVAGDLPWRLLDNKFPLVGRATRSVGVDSGTETVRDILGEIEWAKASLITPDAYAEAIAGTQRTPPVEAEKVAEVYRRYERAKTSEEGMLLDFDDLLLHTAAALENAPAVAEEFHEQYRSFVVDEYQDVTPLQQRVLDAWLGERDDLTVVGDANQTIYSFTGASPDFLLNFTRKYPDATLTRLERDYRSTPQVTRLANAVIGRAKGRVAGTRLELTGMRDPGPEPEFSVHDDEPAEAAAVAKKIAELIDSGVSPAEIAVLYRINAQSAVFEQALSDAGIVYQVRGGEGFFNRAEVRKAITELVRAAQRDDLPAEAVGPGLRVVARAVLAPLGLTPEEPEGAQARERWQSLNALVELVHELGLATPDLDMNGLLVQLKNRAEAKHPPTVQGVTLASLHAAKGLEWDAVFLVGLVENTLPISHAIKAGDHQIEEERRLFYVGVTRARTHLFCSWALARQEGGRKSRKRTRFLDGIVTDPEPVERGTSRNRPKRCRVCGSPLESPQEKVLRRCIDCPGGADDGIFEQLRAWRAETAREDQVPAYIVFSDATLMAIAEAMPADERELLGVSGVGPVKVDKYGDRVLAIVNGTLD
ncbi:ATP-dependent DNA helicase UvrD2 [Corynebacterium pygosceleis]|uniref:DNA 3'-5' helicase n=1 Tax=Corynebacterium pygosceleis TaxID=2800406 RepID=A0A9Q4C966_9CORY|nr:ATP-dependent DNA helicase UvrD2 [Corynebacterium pygosceleis]MCK7637738.1 ATP-dependent DNA helicase UvrD2 [Corynebacterium pygosceleis]MCK7674929.1 ATP-dependent DNA helicase UvrD2 [Corynebacterium pygosceleis]MCL0119482.1 ATP-dependent DNA helicase UvrD2 [Corynebacterium pygosceleis]MCX7444722.1 ATP-dependent DNA helicase UvrD2 [Corynebacterium pygosceleis]MCX7467933.1 ATP-dependent DNA helicase UvrD2 [Corynebacterium pygosceleis]